MWTSEQSIETTASPEAIWRLWSDVAGWPEWNADIEHIEISGPFAAGSTISMTPVGQDPVELRIAEAVKPDLFVDEAEVANVVVRTVHRVERLDGDRNRIVYRMEINGPAADDVGPELGPQISARLSRDPRRARPTSRALMPLHPSQSPGFLLWHATLRWQRDVAAALAPLDLTHVQFVLLACTWWLNEQGEQPAQVRLAAQAGTDIKMTSAVLKTLEDKGLVERRVDPADTRARRLHVTRRGKRLAPRAVAVVERVDAEFFSDLPTADTVDMLGRLAGGTVPPPVRRT